MASATPLSGCFQRRRPTIARVVVCTVAVVACNSFVLVDDVSPSVRRCGTTTCTIHLVTGPCLFLFDVVSQHCDSPCYIAFWSLLCRQSFAGSRSKRTTSTWKTRLQEFGRPFRCSQSFFKKLQRKNRANKCRTEMWSYRLPALCCGGKIWLRWLCKRSGPHTFQRTYIGDPLDRANASVSALLRLTLGFKHISFRFFCWFVATCKRELKRMASPAAFQTCELTFELSCLVLNIYKLWRV